MSQSASVTRTVLSSRIPGEETIAFEVTPRMGVLVEHAPPCGPMVRISVAAAHGLMGHLPSLEGLHAALGMAIEEVKRRGR